MELDFYLSCNCTDFILYTNPPSAASCYYGYAKIVAYNHSLPVNKAYDVGI